MIEIIEHYEYKGYTLQRLQRNFLWYAVKDDLKERIDMREKQQKDDAEAFEQTIKDFKP